MIEASCGKAFLILSRLNVKEMARVESSRFVALLPVRVPLALIGSVLQNLTKLFIMLESKKI